MYTYTKCTYIVHNLENLEDPEQRWKKGDEEEGKIAGK